MTTVGQVSKERGVIIIVGTSWQTEYLGPILVRPLSTINIFTEKWSVIMSCTSGTTSDHLLW